MWATGKSAQSDRRNPPSTPPTTSWQGDAVSQSLLVQMNFLDSTDTEGPAGEVMAPAADGERCEQRDVPSLPGANLADLLQNGLEVPVLGAQHDDVVLAGADSDRSVEG